MIHYDAARTTDPKFELVRKLHLPISDYMIFGSAPLYVYRLRDDLIDLDIVACRLAWQIVTSLGTPTKAPSGYGHMVELYGGKLQFFDRWISADWDVDKLIEEADIINSFPIARLKHVLRSKSQTNRPKDQEDLRILRAYYASIRIR
jgi:hypothetical protein